MKASIKLETLLTRTATGPFTVSQGAWLAVWSTKPDEPVTYLHRAETVTPTDLAHAELIAHWFNTGPELVAAAKALLDGEQGAAQRLIAAVERSENVELFEL